MSKLLLLFLFVSTTFQITHARKPAVDPIVGISIEEYKEVPPSQAKGFDFTKTTNTTRTHSTDGLQQDSATDSKGAENLLIIFLVFLPIIASGITFYLMKKDIIENTDNNVIDIFSNQKSTTSSSDDDDHDENIPKAS